MSQNATLRNEALESSGAPVSGYRWVIATGFVLSNWFLILPSLSFGILLPAIRDSFPLSDTQAGWLSSSARIGSVILTFLSVVFFTRLNPLKLFTSTLLLGTAFTFMMASAVNFWLFAIARCAFGASFSARTPSRPLLGQQWFPLKEIPILQGFTIGLTGIAEFFTLAATPIILSATGSWRTTLFIYGGYGALVFFLWLFFGKERITPDYLEKAKAPKGLSLGGVWRHKELWLVGIGGFAASFGWWAFSTFWPTYVQDAHDIHLKRSGLLFGVLSLSQVPASLVMGVLVTRMRDRRPVFIACGLGMTGALIGMALVTQTWALVLLAIGGGLSWCFMPIMFSMPYEIPGIDLNSVSAGSALLTILLTLGGITGPIVAGAISDHTGSLFIALIASACAPIAFCFLILPVRPFRRAG